MDHELFLVRRLMTITVIVRMARTSQGHVGILFAVLILVSCMQ